MVYIRLPTWKTAIQPSAKHAFDQTGNFTPTQKLMLTRNRIWGNIIGGNVRSGYKELKAPLKGKTHVQWHADADLERIYPFVKNWEKLNKRKETYQNRKLRIFMRGMKIGQKKGEMRAESMSMFDKVKKDNPAEFGQKFAESTLSDESLGISTD